MTWVSCVILLAMKLICENFNLEATLESGQVFGFRKADRGAYAGVLEGSRVIVRQRGRALYFDSSLPFDRSWVADYFDLNRDLTEIYRTIRCEPALSIALRKYRGLRLIRQNAWEALANFILSSNNNVKRIQGIHRNLVRYFEPRRKDGRRGFPQPEEIAKSHERILRQLGLGYRAPYLLQAAKFIAANPPSLEAIREASYEEARQRVLAFPGIGPKVADCVLLYGFHKLEAFPVDVWILRAMRAMYFKKRRVSEETVHAFGQKRWGQAAGYVQQYIFHAARTGELF